MNLGAKPVTTCARDAVLKDLGTLFDQGVSANLADGPLLERFLSQRGDLSELAFRILVERHGPMVLRVCRNVLKDPHDVEDAFQATFMILVRRASSIRKRGSCGSWLHGVALRASARIRTAAARRSKHERKSALNAADSRIRQSAEVPDDLPGLIDEELGRLREHHRSPLVLCYLEGHTCEEAARQLGWPVGTVKSRLARGRERLRRQLIRRGVAPSVILAVGSDLPAPIKTAVPAALQTTVIAECVRIAAQGAVIATLPTTIAALVCADLTRGTVLRVAGVAGVALVGIGLAFAAVFSMPPKSQEDPAPVVVKPARPKAKPGPVHVRVVDLQGKAVAGADVLVLRWEDRDTPLKAGQDGRLELSAQQMKGSVGFLASRDKTVGWGSVSLRFPPENGTLEHPLELVLTPLTHKVTGKIIDPQGRPIAGVRVALRNLGLNDGPALALANSLFARERFPLGSCVTDAEGRYTLTFPADTDVALFTLHPRYVGPTITVYDDEDTVEPVTMRPAGRITGKVSDAATGAPVSGARLYIQPLESNETHGDGGGAVSDAQGKFVMDGLDAGVYNVTLSQVPGRNRATAVAAVGVRVRRDEDALADFKVIDGIPIHGVVIDAETRQPLPDHDVGGGGPAHPSPGGTGTSTDDHGQFTFYVPPGEHVLYESSGNTPGQRSRLAIARVSVPENGKVPPVRLVGPLSDRAPAPAMARITSVTTRMTTKQKSNKATKGAAAESKRLLNASFDLKPVEGRTVTGQVLDSEGRPLAGVDIHYFFRMDFELKLVSWGDGSGAPASDFNLVIVGIDNKNLLHIRIFDAGGNRVMDADETMLPAEQAAAIAKLKRQLPELLPPHGVTTVNSEDVLRQALSIAGRTYKQGRSFRAFKVVSDREGIFITKAVPRGEVTMTAMRTENSGRSDQLSQEVPADRDHVEFRFGPDIDPGLQGKTLPATDEPVPPALRERLTFVSLDPQGNDFLGDGPGGAGDDLNRLPQGIHALDGVFYRIGERLIHLRRPAAPSPPSMVPGIAVGARANTLQILHSARGEVPLGTEVGYYTVHFTDGTSERIPAVYGRDLGNWNSNTQKPPVKPTHARLAWSGSNDHTDRNPGFLKKVHLFTLTWKNPHPDRVIATIDVVSKSTESDLVLVGITLERDPPR